MTYFDVNALERHLHESIHITPRPALKDLRKYLRINGIKPPGSVISTRYPEPRPRFRFMAKHPRNPYLHVLFVHPRLAYISFSGKPDTILKELDRRGFTHGDPQPFESIDKWMTAIQNAIVSMRDYELPKLGRNSTENFTQLDEDQARARIVESVKMSNPDWREPVRHWAGVVLVRHRRHLNTVRRRLVDLVCQLTRDADGMALSNTFRLSLGRIYDTFAYSELHALAEELVGALAPFVALTGADPQLAARRRSEPVERALGYMRERFAEPIGLREVADAVHVSAAHLCRLFKNETGKNLTDYLQAVRIHHARSRLAETNDTLSAIALESGFRTQEHFFRVFKKIVGETPKTYRLAHRS